MGAPTPEVTNGQAKTRRQLVTDLSSHEASGESCPPYCIRCSAAALARRAPARARDVPDFTSSRP